MQETFLRRDFTVGVYLELLEAANKSGYSFITFSAYKSGTIPGGRYLMIRHDIDAASRKALDFAGMEHQMGIKATYYFKARRNKSEINIMQKIIAMGHEVGYHYEDLAKARGDYFKAIKSFEKNLEILRQFIPVNSICMDGSIFSKWNNLDLWDHYSYLSYKILGDPYLELDFNKVLYITDTGRRWNAIKYSIYDKVKTTFSYWNKSSFDIIKDLSDKSLPDQIMMTIHPQRWHSSSFQWITELILQWMKNKIKFLIIKNKSR